MTITRLPQADTPTYTHRIDTDEVTPRFDALVEELAHAAFSVDAIATGLNTSLDTIGTIVRSVPSHE